MTSYQEFIIELPERIYREIEHRIHKVECFVDQSIIYEGHTPIVAYLLIRGRARISKRRSHKDLQVSMTLIGVREFLNQLPFPYTLSVEQGSLIGYLDRDTLNSLLEEGDTEFSEYLGQTLER